MLVLDVLAYASARSGSDPLRVLVLSPTPPRCMLAQRELLGLCCLMISCSELRELTLLMGCYSR